MYPLFAQWASGPSQVGAGFWFGAAVGVSRADNGAVIWHGGNRAAKANAGPSKANDPAWPANSTYISKWLHYTLTCRNENGVAHTVNYIDGQKVNEIDITITNGKQTLFTAPSTASDLMLVNGPSQPSDIAQMDEFRLYAPQTWTAKGGTVNLGDSRVTYYAGHYPTLFTADPDANLTLSNSFTVAVNCPGDFGAADVILAGGGVNLTLDQNKRGDRAATLNARKLQIGGESTATVCSDYRVADGYTIAKKVVFVPDGVNTPTLAFGTAYGTDTPLMDVGSIETAGAGEAKISGASRLGEDDIGVSLAEGTTLTCAATFANAPERVGALKLSGGGTWSVATTSANKSPVFTADSIKDFSGTVVVANKGCLCLSGAVDFPALAFEDGAVVRLRLDRGDRIVDWSKVTFPASGTVTLSLYRADPIAAGEGQIDLNMDLSGVSPEDRAKIVIVVDDKQPSESPYTVTAAPSFDENGNLFAVLSAKMSKSNNTNGELVWLGRDWGDATDVTQWAIFPQNAGQKLREFVAKNIYERKGPEVRLGLRVAPGHADDLRDSFGGDVRFLPGDGGSLEAFVTVTAGEGLYRWLLHHAGQVTVIKPESVRTEFVRRLRAVLEDYTE